MSTTNRKASATKPATTNGSRMQHDERSLPFLRTNRRDPKPRAKQLTEIRGPYYTPIGLRMLEDIFDTMGTYIDSFKFGGGSFALMPAKIIREMIDLCHRHQVTVSTGGFIEHILAHQRESVDDYIRACTDLGFDTIEISAGFISIPIDDVLKLIEKVRRAGLNAKPEIGIQFGAGGASDPSALEAEGTIDVSAAIEKARKCLDAGAKIIMIESEGITECVKSWRTDVPAQFVNALGAEWLMFEAADPEVFQWYIKNFGPDVNLFIDHSQIVQLESLRSGTWGTSSLWGRVISI